MSEFAQKLKRLRWSHNLTIKSFAESLRMNQNTYANYEKGKRKPSLALLKELALVYNIDLNDWIWVI